MVIAALVLVVGLVSTLLGLPSGVDRPARTPVAVARTERIEVFGDLHERGGLEGRLLDRAEAEAAVAAVAA
jgi:hypothetical protein